MAKRILIADDSVTIQKAFAMTFAGQEITLMAARSVDEALGLARQAKPDLVIADGAMPGKSGYDLCAGIKADGNLRAVPVYILSSPHVPYDEGKGRQSGAEGSFLKPFETGAMIDKVNEAMGKGASAVESRASTAPARPAPAAPATVRNDIANARFQSLASPIGETVTTEVTISADPPARPQPRPMPAPAPAPVAPAAAAAHRPTIMAAGGLRPSMIPGARPGTVPMQRPAAAPAAQARPAGAAPLADLYDAAAGARPSPQARPAAAPAHAPAAARPAAPSPAAGRTIMGLPATALQGMRPTAAPAARPQPAPAPAPRPAPTPPPVIMARPAPAPAPAPAPPAVADKVAEKISAIAAKGTEYEAIAKLSREIIEQVVWEVVPELAEIIIRREVDKLKK